MKITNKNIALSRIVSQGMKCNINDPGFHFGYKSADVILTLVSKTPKNGWKNVYQDNVKVSS